MNFSLSTILVQHILLLRHIFFANNKNINESDIITIEKDSQLKKEFRFGSNTAIEVKIVDAVTKEQLDKVIVKQNKVRDLGGLL